MRIVVAFVLAMSGCLTTTPAPDIIDPPAPSAAQWIVGDAVIVNADGPSSFEPTLLIGDDGTMYVAGHHALEASDQAGSPMWWSPDGTQWHRFGAGPLGAAFPGLEGDFALDEEGALYWLDVYAADATLHVWDAGAPPTWRLSRPAVASNSLDDRPHLAAQGDGVLYYVTSSFTYEGMPDPERPEQDGFDWFYRSEDGGLTWSVGQKIPGSFWFCDVDASHEAADLVAVACQERDVGRVGPASAPARQTATLRWSTDQGGTWQRHEVAAFNDTSRPSMDLDVVGERAYFTWDASNGSAADLWIAAFDGETHAWKIPVGGRAALPAIAADDEHVVAFVYVQRATWDLEAYVADATQLGDWTQWQRIPIDKDVTSYHPGDYMMAQVHDGKFWVAYDREDPQTEGRVDQKLGHIVVRPLHLAGVFDST